MAQSRLDKRMDDNDSKAMRYKQTDKKQRKVKVYNIKKLRNTEVSFTQAESKANLGIHYSIDSEVPLRLT